MKIERFDIDVQSLYDVVIGRDVHRPKLEKQVEALMRARHYTRLENIALKYTNEKGDEIKVSATDNTDFTTVRIKIFAMYVQSEQYDYSRSSRERLKIKLGLNELNTSDYMPELIDGRTREWIVNNLEDAVKAFMK